MSKILVTGATGFIGGSISIRLKELGYDVYGIDYNIKKHLTKYFDMFALGDYSEMLKPEFANHKFDSIVHCAGTSLVHPSVTNPSLYYLNNVSRSIKLVDWIKNYTPQSKLIFSSSASVYKNKNEPIKEKDELEPLSPYAKSKKMVEDVILDVSNAHNLRYVIFRFFNACGAISDLHGQDPNATHIFPRLFESQINKSTFTLYGDSIRDYIHVRDLVDAHVIAIENNTHGIYNLGNETGYKNSEIFKKFHKEVGDVDVFVQPKRENEADILVASIDKAKEEMVWQPEYNLDDVIKDLKKWYQSDNYKELKDG